ncbi:hypothetical protein [Halomontanus rarus]|uniref:hypothetical protein n=1 Tax=Halomontanus rarus TaxID=3034020 RepID=UPI00293B8F45|nr:hypothetical protein [Halovivax sp. KZCA124]
MPGSATATTDGASDVIDSLDVTSLPSSSDSELRNKWRRLVLNVRGTSFETDIEKRHSRKNFEKAIELALTNPDSMSISTEPVSRRHDMTTHVRSHFDNLLNSTEWGTEFKHGRPNVEYLLKACELAYIYDSVYRFSRETIIRPELDGLEDVRFVELPSSLNRWMGEVDLVWLILADTLAPEDPLEEFIDRLYEERDEFIAEAKAREIFLPIRSDAVDDPVEIREKIKSRLSRNAHVSPKLVHDYCFTRVVADSE